MGRSPFRREGYDIRQGAYIQVFRTLDYHLECGGRRLLEHMHRTEGGKRQAMGKTMGRPGGPETRFGRFQWDILMCLIITS